MEAAAASAAIPPQISCSALATPAFDFSTVSEAAGSVDSATEVQIDGAEYCEVQGYIAPQEQFDLKLPMSTYTGRYVQLGCGGYCGAAPSGPPEVSTGCPAVTGDEVALGADNQGHSDEGGGSLWARQDPALRVDFGYASEHKMAQLAKAVIGAFYGSPPHYSYFDGCSDGGHEALAEAQRYPRDFDGILAGAPANKALPRSSRRSRALLLPGR